MGGESNEKDDEILYALTNPRRFTELRPLLEEWAYAGMFIDDSAAGGPAASPIGVERITAV